LHIQKISGRFFLVNMKTGAGDNMNSGLLAQTGAQNFVTD